MVHDVVLIPGDGIGEEVTAAARRVIDASGAAIDWHVYHAGGDLIPTHGSPLPAETIAACRRVGCVLKGPITTPIGSGFASVNVRIRKELDVFANFRPAKTLPGIPAPNGKVDLIVIRENTEGLYSGLEHEVVPGVVESLRVITEKGSERILRFTFEAARRYGRKKVTAVHKANILKLSDGLFLAVARRVAKEFPDIAYEEAIVDATAMRLVQNPGQFDVLVMENLFGDILSDLTAGLIGGLGLAPSANIGETASMFEAVHGSAPDIAGKGLANPTALICSSVLMLRHLSEMEAADRVMNAVLGALEERSCLTGDLGGSATTGEYVDELLRRMG